MLHLAMCIWGTADNRASAYLDHVTTRPFRRQRLPTRQLVGSGERYGTACCFTGFLHMRKPSSNKRPTARVKRPTARVKRPSAKTLAVSNDPVKRGPRQRSPQADGSLVGALFNSQVAVAQLMYQLSPLQMITRQQAIILETFTSALNGALEAPERDSKKDT